MLPAWQRLEIVDVDYRFECKLLRIFLDFKGRKGVPILETAEAGALREVAVKNGMKTLRDTGLAKVAEGLTTIDEVLRVTTG